MAAPVEIMKEMIMERNPKSKFIFTWDDLRFAIDL
jgi:hypothetical protein